MVLTKFGMNESTPSRTPMKRLPKEPITYRSIIRSLQYLNLTRYDITFYVNQLSRSVSSGPN